MNIRTVTTVLALDIAIDILKRSTKLKFCNKKNQTEKSIGKERKREKGKVFIVHHKVKTSNTRRLSRSSKKSITHARDSYEVGY